MSSSLDAVAKQSEEERAILGEAKLEPPLTREGSLFVWQAAAAKREVKRMCAVSVPVPSHAL